MTRRPPRTGLGAASGNCYNINNVNGYTAWGGCSQHSGNQNTALTGARGTTNSLNY